MNPRDGLLVALVAAFAREGAGRLLARLAAPTAVLEMAERLAAAPRSERLRALGAALPGGRRRTDPAGARPAWRRLLEEEAAATEG